MDRHGIPGVGMGMSFEVDIFLIALGLAMVFEGLPYFLLAERMPAILRMLAQASPRQLRSLGLVVLVLGLVLISLGRKL